MSSDGNHWRAHMMPTGRNISTSFNFGLATYFVSHYYGRALYAISGRRVV